MNVTNLLQQNDDFLKTILDALPYPFYVISAHDHSIILANRASGVDAIPKGLSCHTLTHSSPHPCSGTDHPCTLEEIRKTKNPVVLEHTHYDREGRIRNVQIYGYPVFDDGGNLVSIIEAAMDITDRRRMETELRESERRLQDFLDNANDLIQSVTPDGRFLYVNQAWKQTLGYGDDDIPRLALVDIIHPDSREHCRYLFHEMLRGKTLHNVEAVFVSKDGRHITVEGNVNLRFESGQPAGTRGIFRNITERKRAEEELRRMNRLLEQLATMDTLTGLFNRLKFNDVLAKETEKSRRYQSPLTLIMFDIDQFKMINDTFGHLTGDRILRDVARLVSNNIRQFEVFARWGGDEFLILSPNIDRDHALKIADKLRVMIERHDFGFLRSVTCSFGLTQFTPEDTVESFTRRADDALYLAKQRGRNGVESL